MVENLHGAIFYGNSGLEHIHVNNDFFFFNLSKLG
jgi:hypothetical protein